MTTLTCFLLLHPSLAQPSSLPPPPPPPMDGSMPADGGHSAAGTMKLQVNAKLPMFKWTALPPYKLDKIVFSTIDDELVIAELDFEEFEQAFWIDTIKRSTVSKVETMHRNTLKRPSWTITARPT
eukprot:TRINITY_DN12625_c1_g2_i12.p2 TRINITY_DN12625_c1_g2~~TRINITY_DN12625_c1_g2_i12.p2  ORF type:complete len:125 (+),score=36.58 TRINITY_DN12625_c1_g2_i12:367-741(+)